jgi:hypothetical protein
MITATQVGKTAGLVDHDIPAMGADVGKQQQRPVVIPYQYERLVEELLQERKGPGVTGCRDEAGVPDELPGRGEQFFFCELEQMWIGVEIGMWCPCLGYIGVNGKPGHMFSI